MSQDAPIKRKRGRPKGSKSKNTLEKEALRELVRERVAKSLKPLVEAQIANALGVKYLVVRDKKSGKFIRVTQAMAKQAENKGQFERVEVWEKDPSVQAFTDLLNRALDKPKEQEQEIKLAGELGLIEARLIAARKRLAGDQS
jgi:hypothetical protein